MCYHCESGVTLRKGNCDGYMADAVAHLRAAGEAVPDELMAHTSPVGWEHIAFSGDFLWDRAAQAASRKALNISAQSRAA